MEQLEQRFLEGLVLTTSRHETQSSNPVREYSYPPIPDDLLVEIFSGVPAKSIARFSCVSKYWASIFCRPVFTELFLTKSLTRPRFLFTVKANDKSLFYSSPQPHNPENTSRLVATIYHKYFPHDISSTVCGLVLLQGCDREVPKICNPATGEFLTLPKVLLKEKNLPNSGNPARVAETYLGYDPVGKQFKALCMTSSYDERPNTHQVLTLESGKRVWRTIEHRFHFEKNDRMRGEICINGVLYFGQSSKIVCFNVRSEKFSFINTNEHRWYSLSLFNYKGKLGLYNHVGENLVLWVLEDAGNHKWSTRSYVFSPPWYYGIAWATFFVGMTSSGDHLVYSWHSCVLFYNLKSNTFKRVSIQGLEGLGRPRFFRPFLDYVENMKVM